MEIKQLAYFLEAARCLHFSKAADNVGVAQSALSQQIARLESELGCRLFDRSNKWKVSLTSAGQTLRAEAEEIMQKLQYAKLKTYRASKGEIGGLSISAIPSFFSSNKFFGALRTMQKKYPDVFFRLSKHSSATIFEELAAGKIDFGVIRVADTSQLRQNFAELGRERVILAIPAKHALAKKKRIFVSDLRDEKFIMIPHEESPFFNHTVTSILQRQGNFTPKISQEIYNFDAVLKMLSDSDCVALVPELLRGQNTYGVLLREVEDLNVDIKYVGIWNTVSEQLENFLKIMRQNFPEQNKRSKK